MSGRPVYVPSRKRTTKKRFHGAFTGGFSAGYFNTVGSAEGWTPRTDDNNEGVDISGDAPSSQEERSNTRQQQRMEDFMDEQDHNEWGGPTGVKREYAQQQAVSSRPAAAHPLVDLVAPPSENVGQRLLRVLGWRDGSATAYVAAEERDGTGSGMSRTIDADANKTASVLSKKRLKKIQLQIRHAKIPPPKQDSCGLGYEPYHDAPEFQRDRARRRRLAQERAKAVTASDATSRDVYRVSNVLKRDEDEDEDGEKHADRGRSRRAEDHDDVHASYETVHDFVGSKTVGGFALREDDDDVYDDAHVSKVSKVNLEDYDTEIHEHHSDVEEEAPNQSANGDIGSVLASWAATTSGPQQTSSRREITSDGRPPLPGFMLGGTHVSSKEPGQTRFPGPDIPVNYEPKRHEFGPDEYPGGLQQAARDEQFEQMEERRRLAAVERKTKAAAARQATPSGPMAGAAFAGLAAAMKSRFTSSTPHTAQDESISVFGMQRPKPARAATDVPIEDGPSSEKKEIKIVRSVMTFAPESLLCKRFHVTPPSNVRFSSKSEKPASPGAEAAFFEREVLKSAVASQVRSSSNKETRSGPGARSKEGPESDEDLAGATTRERPSMNVLASIFEPDSESDMGISDSDEEEQVPPAGDSEGKLDVEEQEKIPRPAVTTEGSASATVQETRQADGVHTGEPETSDTKEKSKDEKRRRKRRRKEGLSSSDDESSSKGRRKRDRRRKEKKKRKKKHKSSRRKDLGD